MLNKVFENEKGRFEVDELGVEFSYMVKGLLHFVEYKVETVMVEMFGFVVSG